MKNSLYQVEMNCPICKVTFSTTRVRMSRCIVKKRDTDFCVYYKEENPIFYQSVVCPQCGYAAIKEDFSNVDPPEVEKIFSNVGRKWKQRDLGGKRSLENALEAYKLVLYCNQLKSKVSHLSTASLCMRLAWLNRYREKVKEEEHFMAHALEQYKKAYQMEKLTGNMDEMTLVYLIGELNRRLRYYDEAITWFSKAVSHNLRFQKPAIEKIAREQWQLAREQSEEERRSG